MENFPFERGFERGADAIGGEGTIVDGISTRGYFNFFHTYVDVCQSWKQRGMLALLGVDRKLV